MVLGRGADHRGAADIDVLDPLVEPGVPLQRRFERIEIDDQEVDRRDVVGEHRGLMRRLGSDRQQTSVHPRVQGLDPAIHHLREAGDLSHVDDREAALIKRRGGAARRKEVDAKWFEGTRQIQEAGLVGNGEERPPDSDDIRGH
jgi:hypothetical protein